MIRYISNWFFFIRNFGKNARIHYIYCKNRTFGKITSFNYINGKIGLEVYEGNKCYERSFNKNQIYFRK